MNAGRSTLGQFWRYVAVGVASNAVLYLAYLALTAIGVEPKLAMSVLYAAGTLQTFLFNKHWSFRSAGAHRPELVRYVLVFAAGYALNLAALFVLVDLRGQPHQLVQAVMIAVVAVFQFVLHKHWVFRAATLRRADCAP